eukprot:7100339-Prymnesium_polylepis.1
MPDPDAVLTLFQHGDDPRAPRRTPASAPPPTRSQPQTSRRTSTAPAPPAWPGRTACSPAASRPPQRTSPQDHEASSCTRRRRSRC